MQARNQVLEYDIFIGPKSLKEFRQIGGEIPKWLDFGFFSWLAQTSSYFLITLYSLCGNWGLSIILLTFFIRLLLLPVNVRSYKSMRAYAKDST